jgi:hypothetical protein
MQIARLTDLCAESLAYGCDDFYGALAKYKNFEPEHVFARKDELAQAFLRKSVELHLQRAFVTYWQRRFVARASGESVYGPDIRCPHADSDGRNARSECAHSYEVFHADATHVIISCMSAHGYHGIRPHIRRARIPPPPVRRTDGRRCENVCAYRIRCSRRLLRSIRALEHRLVMCAMCI